MLKFLLKKNYIKVFNVVLKVFFYRYRIKVDDYINV